jgi:hypothetical protein
MRRNPSPKQRFIKDYARLIYGPDAKSNSLTPKDRTIVKCLFTSLPDHTDLLVQYPAWLEDNWAAIRTHLANPGFKSDISTPGTYLFAPYFVNCFLFYIAEGKKPKVKNPVDSYILVPSGFIADY